MSLLNDLIFFENPTIWNGFGGSDCFGCSGYGGVVWQMFFWSLIVGLLVAAWMAYNLIYFRHADGDPDHDDALKAGVFPHERGNPKIEIAWTIAPLILVSWLTLISLGPLDYMWDVDGQEADITIEVVASQWWWSFETPICNEEKADKEDWCLSLIHI